MAIGGYGSLLDSEIITIGGGTRVCPKPANLTENTYFGTGGYVAGRPLVCGASGTYECQYYSFEQGQWQQEGVVAGVGLDVHVADRAPRGDQCVDNLL